MTGYKADWNIWSSYAVNTGVMLAMRVVKRGESVALAFPIRSNGIGFEKRATVYTCTKKQAKDVMDALNPSGIGKPS